MISQTADGTVAPGLSSTDTFSLSATVGSTWMSARYHMNFQPSQRNNVEVSRGVGNSLVECMVNTKANSS